MKDFFGLLRGWLTGRYRVFPWRSSLLLTVLVIYGLSPVDLIPDFIPCVGIIDDLALLGFLVHSLAGDTRRFKEWGGGNRPGRFRRPEDATGQRTPLRRLAFQTRFHYTMQTTVDQLIDVTASWHPRAGLLLSLPLPQGNRA